MSAKEELSEDEKKRFDDLIIDIYWAVEYGNMEHAREVIWREIQQWR